MKLFSVMKGKLISLLVLFFGFNGYSQNFNPCAVKIGHFNKQSVMNYYSDFYANQPILRQKREKSVNKNQQYGASQVLDIIKIKRRVVKAPSGQINEFISDEKWNQALARANAAFLPISIEFVFDPIIDTIFNSNFYQYNPEFDEGLFVKSNLEEGKYVINYYVVGCIAETGGTCIPGVNGASGKSSIPNYENFFDLQNDANVPGNSILIIPWGINNYAATFVHELGHFFGLLHTFENVYGQENIDASNSASAGDFISDTKANIFELKDLVSPDSGVCNLVNSIPNCNGQLFSPDMDNYMSYFKNECLRKFTPLQYDLMFQVKERFRGYLYLPMWVQVSVENTDMRNYSFCNLTKIKYKVSKSKNVQVLNWQFPGGSPASSQMNEVEVDYPSFGLYSFYATASNGVLQPFTTKPINIEINDPENYIRPLPISADFETGLPNPQSGWKFQDYYWDCYYFNMTNVGAFGNSNRSIYKSSFSSSVKKNKFDFFETPFFSINSLSELTLQFDYAYASKSNPGDTLLIEYLDCNKWTKLWEFGGSELETAPQLNNVAFLPNTTQWKSILINCSSLLTSNSTKASKFAFTIKSFNGNRIYIDNIKINGRGKTPTNSLLAEYSKSQRSVFLSWQNFSQDPSSITIERSFSEEGPWRQLANLSSNVVSYEDVLSIPNTILFYRLKTVGATQEVAYSNIANDTTSSLPARPSNLLVSIASGNNTILNWNSNGESLTGYNLFYSLNRNGNYDTLAKLGPETTSFIHENVPSNTRIYYFVKAVDHNFSSLPSDTGFVSFLNPSATTLTRLEYYYDTDPGPGNGTAVNLNNAHAIDRHFDFPVSSLAEGVHQLYFRVQDNIGNWSNVYSNSFIKLKGNAAPTIIDSVEYYFDQFDPGVGKATRIDLTLIAGPEYTIPVELSSLSDGAHILHLRSRNSKGLWSAYWSGGFIKLPGNAVSIIDKVEYFIDSDPGFGQGINVPINSLSKIDTSIHLNLSLVPTGLHKLFLRAKDAAGLWSNIFSRNFIRVLGDSGRYVTELEYYFDSEPGIGNGNTVSFPTPKAKVDTVLNLNLGALSDGMHMLYVRSKDVAGQWSNIINKSFLRTTGSGGTPEIIKLEYYVDSDPGLGLASNIDTATLSPGVYNIELPTNAFTLGEHNLYIRAKDSKGFWSVIYSGGFHIVNNTECSCAKLVYTTSKLSSASYQWQVDTGSGFRSIADTGVYFGTQTDSLKISNPPTSYAFNKYRCLITSPSGTSFSSTFELRYNMSWKGGESADWHDPKNWGCIVVPDENIDVVIPGSKPNYPILTKDSKVGSLKLESGSSVTVAPGVKLEIKR